MNLKIEKIHDVITSIPIPIIREAWSIDDNDDKNFKHYPRACKTFYKIIKLVVRLATQTGKNGWHQLIKENLFRVKIYHSYYKDLNNWPYIKSEVTKYYNVCMLLLYTIILTHVSD